MVVKGHIQRTIGKFLLLGKTTSEISFLVGISETAVKNHLQDMYLQRGITVKHKRLKLVQELLSERDANKFARV